MHKKSVRMQEKQEPLLIDPRVTHQHLSKLVPTFAPYLELMIQYIWKEVQRDNGVDGDKTSTTLFVAARQATAHLVAKEDGYIAGIQELRFVGKNYFAPNIDVVVDCMKQDGDKVKRGDVILELKGNLCGILNVERAVVNFMARMSGVATKTANIVSLVSNVKNPPLVTATRKTLWGLLDKRAAAIGGAGTHRLTLADGILIKDTHLDPMGRDIEGAIRQFFVSPLSLRKAFFFEIEVRSMHEAVIAAETFASLRETRLMILPCYIMLDNMSVSQIAETLITLNRKGLRMGIGIEASGGINESNIVSYAKTGVDVISLGCLTHSAKSLDLSLKVL